MTDKKKAPDAGNKKINYDEKMKEAISSFGEKKPTLLLHSCCGPCSTACLERLFPHFIVTVFFFNPNITESEEYNLRLDEQKRFLKEAYGDMVALIEGRYRSREFFELAEGLEKAKEGGERCAKCFEYRLKETEKVATENKFDYFATTLTVSPHKNCALVNEIGFASQREGGSLFLPSDFKKEDGYKRSVAISAEHGLYRQRYCGCIYSKYQNIVPEEEEES